MQEKIAREMNSQIAEYNLLDTRDSSSNTTKDHITTANRSATTTNLFESESVNKLRFLFFIFYVYVYLHVDIHYIWHH